METDTLLKINGNSPQSTLQQKPNIENCVELKQNVSKINGNHFHHNTNNEVLCTNPVTTLLNTLNKVVENEIAESYGEHLKNIEPIPSQPLNHNAEIINRVSIKRKADESLENENNLLLKCKKMSFSNDVSYPIPDLDLPQDLFNDTNSSNLQPQHQTTFTQPPISTNFICNSYPKEYEAEIKHFKTILKEQLKASKNNKYIKGKDGNLRSEYAQYLGLQPAVKFKCFKCGESQFSSLYELKEHQVICLNKTTGTKGNNNVKNEIMNKNNFSQSSLKTSDNHTSSTEKIPNSVISNSNNSESTKIRITRKVFLCSACGTYYENWNLFLHMREVHKRHICLYCLGLFPTSEKLVNHLENKHNVREKIFESKEHLIKSYNNPCYLMCSNCEHVFNELDDFHNHLCENYVEPCSICGLKSNHTINCKLAVAVKSSKIHKDKEKKKIKSNSNNGNITAFSLSNNNNQRADNYVTLNNSNKVLSTSTENSYMPNGVDENNMLLPENSSHSHNQESHIRPTSETNQPVDNLHSKTINDDPPDNTDNNPPDKLHDNDEDDISESSSTYSSEDDEINTSNENTFPQIVSNPSLDDISGENGDNRPLLVPKLKIKINSKSFTTPIELDESSSSSGEEDENESEEIESDADDELDKMDVDEVKCDTKEEENDEPLNTNSDDMEETKPKEFEKMEDNNYSVKDEVEEQLEVKVFDSIKCKKEDETTNAIEQKLENIDNINTAEDITETMEDSDGIIIAGDDTLMLELILQSPLDKIAIQEFIRICLKSSIPYCLYCNHARRIAVNGKYLALHLIGQHRFSATVDSITAEELQPSTIVARLKSNLEVLETMYFNMDTYDSHNKEIMPSVEKIFECFQCRFITKIHKELYLHNRKMHLKSILLCIMCKSNFYSYSELLCHICPGIYNKVTILDILFRCCLCNMDNIPSAFRLMVHLRKKHNACDVCLEECFDQSRLSNHVWKHKLHHLCYRCGIAYRNKPDITKHLFWKHGTESVLCKRCLQKKWPHVYHFCIPPAIFVCDVCSLTFNRAVSLKVHKRLHTGDAKYPCTEDDCDKKFISRKLLLKHVSRHSMIIEEIPVNDDLNIEQQTTEEIEEIINNDSDENITKSEAIKKERKKKQKSKVESKTKSVIDIMDLPALNLSESDSSDEENILESNRQIFNTSTSLFSDNIDIENVDEESKNNLAPIIDIWDNFKTFQATQKQTQPMEDNAEPILPPPILHVLQSDHDYSMMYRPIKDIQTDDKKDDIVEQTPKLESSTAAPTKPSKNKTKTKTPKKPKESESSSSDSSSGSDSCSCGTDCSCSSSSSGSSSSSSSDDESSNSESRRKNAAKKEQKKRQKLKSENKAINDPIDVEADSKIDVSIDPDTIIFESDLTTDESETDEDFYDDHPQKLANQILAEKRKQLMLQTCLNPMNNAVVENSRPSTPSLPEEMVKEKRVKIKKKKKKKATSTPTNTPTTALFPPLKLTIPIQLNLNQENNNTSISTCSISPPHIFNNIISSPLSNFATTLNSHDFINMDTQSSQNNFIPMQISNAHRISTGSGSETDGNIKRSKRRRIPNRFYGYSSDEESTSMMKPTPPPNLTWRKEDLPSPTTSPTPPLLATAVKTKIKSPALTSNKTPLKSRGSSRSSSPVNNYPLIPPVIIRPLPPPVPVPIILPQPPRVEALRVPSVPVHHLMPPILNNDDMLESSDTDSSDSSSEGCLQISQKPIAPLKTKIILNKKQLPSLPPPPSLTLPLQDQKPVVQYQPRIHSQARSFAQNSHLKFPVFLPPPGSRIAKEGESVYCYCQCPYDEVSEMIACDGDDCHIEWFHFECVGIMVPPEGKWYCPDCKPKYLSGNNEYLEEDNT